MRHPAVAFTALFACSFWRAPAIADHIHMPCDEPVALSMGTGIFTGNSKVSSLGDTQFERIQLAFTRLETTIFSNCVAYTARDADLKPVSTHDRVTRWWLGSLSLYGSITPETTKLAFHDNPKTAAILDGSGNPVVKTENALVKASLEAGTDFSGDFGARLSLIDTRHFHVEAYGEVAGSFNWNPARANTVVAHALELDIDVTEITRDHAELSYRWDMENVGVTIGVPLRPNTVSKNRLTPFVSIGYTWFSADVDLKLDESVTRDMTNLGIDVTRVAERRSIRKSSVTALLGARLDFNKNFSLEASAIFAKTASSTLYWFTGSAVFRFDYPWKW